MKKILNKLFWFFFSILPIFIILLLIFMPIFKANSIIFPYALTPFDICKLYPDVWLIIKKCYWICFFISYFIVFNFIYTNIYKNISKKLNMNPNTKLENKSFNSNKFLNLNLFNNNTNYKNNQPNDTLINLQNRSQNPNNLQLLIGKNFQDESIYIPEKGLYQNILITGTIGSR